mmetsp:Transcript_38815/g.71165  ORF Transcript_38815/g.71165 Transcript_38815/m.71165 type:complete len:171 (+) Transcript_38815:111-623(+)|eukprot:CAMPEP_0202011246 /NCGR_PEP_ID=MMETSP0905-20130828/18955_1 /ASSEMBLY_ACC=CAM_ASM_000554 /TAXON_ID=420261 /ORGANISM="Thalassiosira antarctica, Strain CCMP982" /LENGTH=170 /DNA_ID=CAMNT_0048570019 /DNA_START=126 /DNA_END=638 /DNA_ORIENTATION=+
MSMTKSAVSSDLTNLHPNSRLDRKMPTQLMIDPFQLYYFVSILKNIHHGILFQQICNGFIGASSPTSTAKEQSPLPPQAPLRVVKNAPSSNSGSSATSETATSAIYSSNAQERLPIRSILIKTILAEEISLDASNVHDPIAAYVESHADLPGKAKKRKDNNDEYQISLYD